MDLRQRWQEFLKTYGSPNPNRNNNFKKSPRHSHQSYSWRRENYQTSKFQNNRRQPINKTPTRPDISAEDAEEEERKKKLSDTANKLLSIIKNRSTEESAGLDSSKQNSENFNGENSSLSENPEGKSSGDKQEGEPKRIAHSKTKAQMVRNPKANLIRNPKAKVNNSPSKTILKNSPYDVNKKTVKDFQSRIQQKLINEIMQMPKENLQNVLNDPKINPIMELKMSRLVKENKLLIAQKLRALAESKMKSTDTTANSQQLLEDIDKLIDPVIETDLSVLPFELIKQMENIFQVQFDYTDACVSSPEVCDVANGHLPVVAPESVLSNICEVKETRLEVNTSNDDLEVYRCSTDEDEEIQCLNVSLEKSPGERKRRKDESSEMINPSPDSKRRKTCTSTAKFAQTGSIWVKKFPTEEKPLKASKPCQTTKPLWKNESCQTSIKSQDMDYLYGAPIPKKSTDDSLFSLLEEVNSIRTLIDSLNARRFTIFIELAKKNPSGNFNYDNFTSENFVETIANGSLYLVDALRHMEKSIQTPRVNNKKKNKNSKKKKKSNNANQNDNNPVQN